MKKNIIILLLTFCCIVHAQQNTSTSYTYRPLSEFHLDTLRFLRTNFMEQSMHFHGKTVGEVLKYYEKDLPINIVYSDATSPYINPKGKSYMETISISFYTYEYFYSALKSSNVPIIFFKIYLAKPFLDDYKFWFNMPEFETDREEAWYMKDLPVDRIEVYRRF